MIPSDRRERPRVSPPETYGSVEAPRLRDVTVPLPDDDSGELRVRARLLGYSSSERTRHSHDGDVAPPGRRCSACRWFEVRIYEVDVEYVEDCTCEATAGVSGRVSPSPDPAIHDRDCGVVDARARYLVATSGPSVVPGEVNRRRAVWTDSPWEVRELLTQRNGADVFVPARSARALSQAARWDEGLREAYVSCAAA